MSWLCSLCGNMNNDSVKLCDKCGELHRVNTPVYTPQETMESSNNEIKKECRDYASRFRRLIACFIDMAILVGVYFLIAKTNMSQEKLLIVLACIQVLYYVLLEWSPLQGTIGKLILGICVNNKYGEKISFFRSVSRTLVKVILLAALLFTQNMFGPISIIVLLVIYGTIYFTEKRQTLYDMISGTIIANRGL